MMERRSVPEAQRLLGGSLSEDDDIILEGNPNVAEPKVTEEFNQSNKKLRKVQFEVEQVQGIIRDNVEKILERGDRVVELADKSDGLSSQADSFLQASKRMQQRLWWRQYKGRIILAVVAVTALLIIVVTTLTTH